MFKTINKLEKDRSNGENTGRLDEQNELATDKQNTGINTLEIMGKMGNTWRGAGTSIKTGEMDQGVTAATPLGVTPGLLPGRIPG
jgi:hypothetical protein